MNRMRAEVKAATSGLTCSAGIAANTMLAKIASNERKPDGQMLLPFDRASIVAYMASQPVRRLPGVGKVTEKMLVDIGFATCGDILLRKGLVRAAFGERMACWLIRCALGIGSDDSEGGGGGSGGDDDNGVGRKSISQERTFRDCSDASELAAKAREMASIVASQMVDEGIVGRTVTVKLKFASFEGRQRSITLSRPTSDVAVISAKAEELLRSSLPVTLRLLGVRMSGLSKAGGSGRGTLLEAFRKADAPAGSSSSSAGGGGSSSSGAGAGAAAASSVSRDGGFVDLCDDDDDADDRHAGLASRAGTAATSAGDAGPPAAKRARKGNKDTDIAAFFTGSSEAHPPLSADAASRKSGTGSKAGSCCDDDAELDAEEGVAGGIIILDSDDEEGNDDGNRDVLAEGGRFFAELSQEILCIDEEEPGSSSSAGAAAAGTGHSSSSSSGGTTATADAGGSSGTVRSADTTAAVRRAAQTSSAASADKPASTAARASQSSLFGSSSASTSAASTGVLTVSCPVCGARLLNDSARVNEHVDRCVRQRR